jgi:hypothetical protein
MKWLSTPKPMARTASSVSAAHFHLLNDDFLREDDLFRKENLLVFEAARNFTRAISPISFEVAPSF